ncbi:hypothetical protein BGX23_000770 [Mortierella sp. AD031]|nr:hypothetical protein BGX23_000770 [Mortierella sp. AD031]KAG0215494.1 hypothetical protein BGX33_001167 [Mortierella sp. NVP41]
MTTIPQYANACLAPSPSNSTVFLVGVSGSTNGRLEINSIDLADINNPLSNLTNVNDQPQYWRSQSGIYCHNYPHYQPPDNQHPLHIQQFDPNWSFDTNVFPNGKVDVPTYFPGIGLTSSKHYMVVGHFESQSWSLGQTNTTHPTTDSTWSTFQLSPVNDVKVQNDNNMVRFPKQNPFLSVGTYILYSKLPARGFAIVFDTPSTGWLYLTTAWIAGSSKYTGNYLQLDPPLVIEMLNITLTKEAIGVPIGSAAYILDKASDNSTVVYHINPKQLENQVPILQRFFVPASPRYTSSLIGTAMGSQIVVYSANANGPRFNIYDPTSNTWSGPDLVPQSMIPADPKPGTGNTKGGNNDHDNGHKLPLPAIIGGVLGGVVIIVLAIFFMARRRPRQSRSSLDIPSSRGNYNPVSKSKQLRDQLIQDEQQCTERKLATLRSPQLNPAQTYTPQPTDRLLGRNPQSPAHEGSMFFSGTGGTQQQTTALGSPSTTPIRYSWQLQKQQPQNPQEYPSSYDQQQHPRQHRQSFVGDLCYANSDQSLDRYAQGSSSSQTPILTNRSDQQLDQKPDQPVGSKSLERERIRNSNGHLSSGGGGSATTLSRLPQTSLDGGDFFDSL